jgi:effector-binding domain-containing protein
MEESFAERTDEELLVSVLEHVIYLVEVSGEVPLIVDLGEAGLPVATAVAGAGQVEASTLPAGPAAVTVHTGRYEDLGAAYNALLTWVHSHGYQPAGPHWENYLSDPTTEPNSEAWQTEVVLPYRQ